MLYRLTLRTTLRRMARVRPTNIVNPRRQDVTDFDNTTTPHAVPRLTDEAQCTDAISHPIYPMTAGHSTCSLCCALPRRLIAVAVFLLLPSLAALTHAVGLFP